MHAGIKLYCKVVCEKNIFVYNEVRDNNLPMTHDSYTTVALGGPPAPTYTSAFLLELVS